MSHKVAQDNLPIGIYQLAASNPDFYFNIHYILY